MKKTIIIAICIIVLGLLTWAFIHDLNRDPIETLGKSDKPGVDVELTDENYITVYEDMKHNHDLYIGKIICYEGFVHNNGDVCFVARCYRDNENKQDVVYGPECWFKDGAKFEDNTWLRIYGVLDEDTEDLTGKTYLYVIVAPGDYEVIEEGKSIIAEIN